MKDFDLDSDVYDESLDVRCFCKKHADEYQNSDHYILKRLNYEQSVRDKCDKCDRLGFDYILIHKSQHRISATRNSETLYE